MKASEAKKGMLVNLKDGSFDSCIIFVVVGSYSNSNDIILQEMVSMIDGNQYSGFVADASLYQIAPPPVVAQYVLENFIDN